MRRTTLVTVTVTVSALAAAVLTGCAATPPSALPPATATAVARKPVATPTTAAPAAAAPAVAADDLNGPAAGPSSPAGDPSVAEQTTGEPSAAGLPASGTQAVSALAQHVYDECSEGAAAAGVRLTFTADPSGYTADGRYQLVYPFRFLDGHDDQWAVYNCTLTDDTVSSTYIGGGLTDSH